MRFERRDHPSRALTIAAPIGAVLAALIVAGLLIAIAGANPIRAYGLILKGASGRALAYRKR